MKSNAYKKPITANNQYNRSHIYNQKDMNMNINNDIYNSPKNRNNSNQYNLKYNNYNNSHNNYYSCSKVWF